MKFMQHEEHQKCVETKPAWMSSAVNKIEQESPTLMDLLLGHEIDLVIDIPKQGEHSHDGFLIRRTSIETGVTCLTSLDTANALLTSLENVDKSELSLVDIATIEGRGRA